jgi:hypothetical protein
MTRSYGSSTFSFWGTFTLIFIVVTPIYIPTSSIWRFLCQHLLFIFLIITILIGVRWNPNVVLICISLMTKDA